MARTRLMSWLQRLAAEYRAADRMGLPLDAVREQAAARASRRQLLKGGAAIAAAGAVGLPGVARAAAATRIAIVGGGIAGLNAALTLQDGGYASTIYEAGGRVGGRMYSNNNGYWTNNQVSEWGGELIDSGHKTIQTLARRFNLTLDDLAAGEPNGSEMTMKFFGQYYTKAQADIDFQPVHNALQGDVQAASYPTTYYLSTPEGRALDSMSVYEWIESRVPGGHTSPLGQLLDIAYNIEYGAESTVQSALNLVYLLGYGAKPGNFDLFGKSDERYHIRGGNQQLPIAIKNALPAGSYLTGYKLLKIKKNADGTFELTFDRGQASNFTTTADIVILALPFAVLRTLDYSQAGFDAMKVTAITQMGAGRNGKLHVQFTSRFWNGTGPWPGIGNGDSYADTGYQNTWDVSRSQQGQAGILVDYTGGNVSGAMVTNAPWATIGAAGVQTDVNNFFSRAATVWPMISQKWNGKATSSLPFKDPNLLLAYSYWKVGQYQQFAGYEKVRQGNCFFAGEHCSIDFQGYMEGGAGEGARAAGEVLQQLPRAGLVRPLLRMYG